MPRVTFGIFDFDTETNQLRRNGLPVRLQAQPALVLAGLLAHPGAVVTRESLRDAVWKGETFVDFDRGLNFCIAQVRSALGDSAESPRYVQTLPKKGYQFIAPVTTEGPAPPRRSRLWFAAGAAVAALVVTAGFTWKTLAPKGVQLKVAIA